MIFERPPEVCDRAVPGHWEGDLLMGTRDLAIATLVERQTRYCQLAALPEGTNAEPVCETLKASITTLPVQLRRSLTSDQGKEMAEHRRFSFCGTSRLPSVETDIEVYFCDLRSPGSEGPTRTRTASFASTSRKARASPAWPRQSSTRSPASSTTGPADARLPDPRRETHRSDRQASPGRPRALTSLRTTAFARQRPDRMRRCATSGVVH